MNPISIETVGHAILSFKRIMQNFTQAGSVIRRPLFSCKEIKSLEGLNVCIR